MPEKEEKIAISIERILPMMTELERERLYGFAEGMAFMKNVADAKTNTEQADSA